MAGLAAAKAGPTAGFGAAACVRGLLTLAE